MSGEGTIIVKRWVILHLVLKGKRFVFGQFNGCEAFSLSHAPVVEFDPVDMVVMTKDGLQYRLEGPTEERPMMIATMKDDHETCLDVSEQYMGLDETL